MRSLADQPIPAKIAISVVFGVALGLALPHFEHGSAKTQQPKQQPIIGQAVISPPDQSGDSDDGPITELQSSVPSINVWQQEPKYRSFNPPNDIWPDAI